MTDMIGGNAKQALKSFVERIERLSEEKKELGSAITEIYAEAKGQGFDAKAMRKVIALRKLDADDRVTQEAILATYMHALGMVQGDLFEDKAAA